MTQLPLLIAGCLLPITVARGGEPAGARFGRLAAEDSSYLRSQAPSAIEWHAWGPDAWSEAERTGRPLFLSIGYFSCAWTSRMDRDVFQEPATAAQLNANCVNVKIDRFERPDLDRLYQRFAEATRQGGGWPLNLWASPDRLPIRVAATLTSKEAGQGSFSLEAGHVLKLWAKEAAHVTAQARIELDDLATRTGSALAGPLEIDESLVRPAHSQILGQFDPVHGGFGRLPKFPYPARLGLLVRRAARAEAEVERGGESRDVIRRTLAGMARSGLRDHLGGGFFRYALDEAWRRPYFEKLALDQALLADAYLLGHRLIAEADCARVAGETLDYAIRELGHPEGGFYTAEHGESRSCDEAPSPLEGAFYAWSRADLRRHAGDGAEAMEQVYDIRDRGNLPPGTDPFNSLAGMNLLAEGRPVSEVAVDLELPLGELEARLARGRAALFAARQRRPRPPLDRLLITQMNAALISALCRASLQLNNPAWLNRARRAADFIHSQLWDDSTATLYRCRLDRAPRHLAVADDHAFLVRALLDLHETTGEIRWLQRAVEVQAAFDRHHADRAGGGYWDARHDCPDVPVALKTIDDASGISPNAVAGMNLVRWSVLLQDASRAVEARRLLGAFAVPLRSGSASVAGLFEVADALVHPPQRILLLGPPDHPEVRAARVLLAGSRPGRWQVLSVGDAAARRWLSDRHALPPAAASHPLGTPAFCLPDAGSDEKGPILMMELDKTLSALR